VPAADAALLGGIGGWRAVLNLGGIANLTLLPPGCGPDRRRPVRGWDCGPANTLLDLAVARFSGGRLAYDDGGRWAGRGRIHEERIRHWLREPYFQRQPPKSTGRELFGRQDLEHRLAELEADGHGDPADALATLTAFTAAVVAADLERDPRPLELLLAGGGARNLFLFEQLRRRCRGLRVRALTELGIDEHQREALAFALLAWWHRIGHPGSLPSVTGARRPSVLGVCAAPGMDTPLPGGG
jgi:anhydro-N-acetylmuramic acid kinase